MQIVEQYNSCLDAHVLQHCREYIAISPSEIPSYGPIQHLNIAGITYVFSPLYNYKIPGIINLLQCIALTVRC